MGCAGCCICSTEDQRALKRASVHQLLVAKEFNLTPPTKKSTPGRAPFCASGYTCTMASSSWKKFICLFAQEHPDFRVQVGRYVCLWHFTFYMQELQALVSAAGSEVRYDYAAYSNEVWFVCWCVDCYSMHTGGYYGRLACDVTNSLCLLNTPFWRAGVWRLVLQTVNWQICKP